MTRTERLTFIAELIEITSSALAQMNAERDLYSNALIGSDSVIRTSKSLYIVAEQGTVAGTIQYRPTALTGASRFYHDTAKRVCLELQASPNVGPNWSPELVSIHQALKDEIRNYSAQLEQYKEMRESIEQQPE